MAVCVKFMENVGLDVCEPGQVRKKAAVAKFFKVSISPPFMM